MVKQCYFSYVSKVRETRACSHSVRAKMTKSETQAKPKFIEGSDHGKEQSLGLNGHQPCLSCLSGQLYSSHKLEGGDSVSSLLSVPTTILQSAQLRMPKDAHTCGHVANSLLLCEA